MSFATSIYVYLCINLFTCNCCVNCRLILFVIIDVLIIIFAHMSVSLMILCFYICLALAYKFQKFLIQCFICSSVYPSIYFPLSISWSRGWFALIKVVCTKVTFCSFGFSLIYECENTRTTKRDFYFNCSWFTSFFCCLFVYLFLDIFSIVPVFYI